MANNINPNDVIWDTSTSDLIGQHFPPEAVDTAKRVVNAESSDNPLARNVNNNNTQDSGLFQINDIHIPELQKAGIISSPQDLFVPKNNVKAAAYLYSKQGFKPWSASQSRWAGGDNTPQAIDPSQVQWDAPNSQMPESQVPSPSEQAALTHTKTQVTNYPTSSWKNIVSNIARPTLQALGMAGGGIAGLPLAPESLGMSSVAGAGLGYAAGEQVANKLDEAMGLRQPKPIYSELAQVGKDIGRGAAYEMGGQAAGVAIPAALKFAGRGIKQVLGASTGSGPGTMEEALKGSKTFTDAMRGKVSGDEIVSNVRGALQDIKAQRAAAYQDQLVNVTANKAPIDISPIKSKLKSLVEQYGGKINADGSVNDLSRIAMGKSGRRDISDIIETIKEWGTKEGDNTAIGLDTLKRQLDDFYSDSSQARQFVTAIRNTVKDTIIKDVPEYANMTKGYASATNMIKDIESGLMLRKQGMTGRVTGDMTLRRLMSAMKSNNELRLDLLKTLGNQASTDLTGQVAGYVSSDIVPHGLVGKLAGGSAAYISYLNPKFWPLLAASSPRIVGEFLRTYGKTLAVASKGGPQAIPSMVKGISLLGHRPQDQPNNAR